MKSFLLRGLAVVALLLCAVAKAEPALVGNKSFAGQTLDVDAVKAVLLGKRVTVGDTRVVIVIAKAGDAQDQLLKNAVGMTTSQFQNYWRRLFMTGGGTAPKIVETDDEACKLVAETPGGVAIADTAKAGGLVVLNSGK